MDPITKRILQLGAVGIILLVAGRWLDPTLVYTGKKT